MDEMTLEEQEAVLLKGVPEDGTAVGNTTLMRTLQWTPIAYWPVRNRLVERGFLELGRGQGGSVRRAMASPLPKQAATPEATATGAPATQADFDREFTLYAPMAKVWVIAGWPTQASTTTFCR